MSGASAGFKATRRRKVPVRSRRPGTGASLAAARRGLL
jgi:hypothetical protein